MGETSGGGERETIVAGQTAANAVPRIWIRQHAPSGGGRENETPEHEVNRRVYGYADVCVLRVVGVNRLHSVIDGNTRLNLKIIFISSMDPTSLRFRAMNWNDGAIFPTRILSM